MSYCPKCGNEVDDSEKFCPKCGFNINQESNAPKPKKESEFVKSIGTDVKNSQTIKIVKEKAKTTKDNINNLDSGKKKKYKIVGIVAACLVVLLCVVTNIHKCAECDKVYFGKKHTISFYGESENVCKDCYDDNNSWF